MDFIDHTGHIFQMKSYSIKPIGYGYETTQYVFWFDNEQGYKTSVDTYAIKPIRILLDTTDFDSIEITIDSKKFSLLSSKQIQVEVEKLDSISDSIRIDESLFTDSLIYVNDDEDKQDLYIVKNLSSVNNKNENKSLVTFYVAVNSPEAGTWQTNVLIHVIHSKAQGLQLADEEWCPITVGAEIVDECEELIINGHNVGVRLPKEILKAIYQTSYYGDYPDERLYAQKLKEYLMNYMGIKGQQGNYKSALTALKWFGWGDKLDVYKLIKTDNEFQSQYIRDNFDLVNDTLYSYRYFKNDALLSIVLNIDEISDDTAGFDFKQYFWGEDKPYVSSLFEKTIIKHYDEGDLDFYRGYFDFSINELGLKLCMLKYYYEKYFLPMHLALNSVSMMQTVFANDIKLLSNGYPKITAQPVFIKDSSITVKFPVTSTIYLKAEKHNIDENFIEFNDTVEAKYAVYDTLINIPITFLSKNADQYYDMILTLHKDDKVIYSRKLQFTQLDLKDTTQPISEEFENDPNYQITYSGNLNFIVHPKTFNRYLGGNGENIDNERFTLNLWLDSEYTLDAYVNHNNYQFKFKLKMPDMILNIGTLEYQYDQRFRQLYKEDNKLNFLSYMHMPGLVTVNNIDYIDDLYFFQDSLGDYVDKYYKTRINIPDNKYLNVCHMYKILKDGKTVYAGDHVDFDTQIKFNLENNELVWDGEFNEQDKSLYEMFFDTECDNDKYVEYCKELKDIIESKTKIQYDFYLMRDNEKNPSYYAVLISKYTMKTYDNELLKAPELPEIGGYTFKYDKSDTKFLINRFVLRSRNNEYLVDNYGQFVLDKYNRKIKDPNYGKYKFNDKDIIAFYLQTNEKLPYKVGLSTKWEIKPMSLGMSNDAKVESPNEIAIVSIGDKNFKYEKGYYTIVCKYSLDDYFQESMQKKAIFVVS